MNTYRIFRFIIWAFVGVMIILGIGIFALSKSPAIPVLQEPSAKVFGFLNYSHFFIQKIFTIKGLIDDNINLKKESEMLRGQIAKSEYIQSENDALREALDIKRRFGRSKAIPAGIYAGIPLNNGRWQINRGSEAGIKEGDIVVLEDSILVGKVDSVFESFSHVIPVDSKSMQITAKVLNGLTKGLVVGLGDESLKMELVVQSDKIQEGDSIVTTGDDQFPGGLVVGFVTSVGTSGTDVFKDVRIAPAFRNIPFGKVVVIDQNM